LIHRASQLLAALIITGVALVLVVLLNLSLHSSRIQSTAAIATVSPELGSILQAQNRFELMLGIAASLVFLLGIFAVTILETHKTAGAAYHLCRELERIRDGLYGIRVKLRKGDNLREVESAFNEMSRTLAERAVVEVEELEHAASVADRVESPLEASDLAKALREMADERRRLSAGLRSR
jgi:signal transduction histidine kinase